MTNATFKLWSVTWLDQRPDGVLIRLKYNTLIQHYLSSGLGDSNYSSYQTIPRKIDKQLTALGATRLFETGEADDQVGFGYNCVTSTYYDFRLELVVEPWIEKFFAVLATRFNISEEKMNVITDSLHVKLNQIKTEEEKQALLLKRRIDEDQDEEEIGIEILHLEPYEYPELSLLKGCIFQESSFPIQVFSGSSTLSNDENLRVPIAPQPFIVSSVSHKKLASETKLDWQNSCKMPGVVTEPFDALVVSAEFVTDPFSKKIKMKRMITVDFGSKCLVIKQQSISYVAYVTFSEHAADLQYEPGDAIYFCVPNPAKEVNFILKRCGVLSIADQLCELSIDSKTEKINAQIPGHVHKVTSLRHIFTTCLDIRRAPGRVEIYL